MHSVYNTASTLTTQIEALGLKPGVTLMVHAAFSRVGWTEGGAESAVQALLNALGPDGTLVMPAASPQLSPADAELLLPPGPGQLFDPRNTPTTMGALAECFRTWPGTLRSNHPLESVCAKGPNAREIVSEHAFVFCEGRGTPFEKLYTLGAFTLLLGVGFNRCTSLHYAEFLSTRRRTTQNHLPIVTNGESRWLKVQDMAADKSTHFPLVGERFASAGAVRKGKIGRADSLLFSTPQLVDFAKTYFDEYLDPTV